MNDTSLVSKLYGVKLPQNIIDQLEGTDDKLYFVHKKDCRTEAQIVAEFNKLLDNSIATAEKIHESVSYSAGRPDVLNAEGEEAGLSV